MLGKYFRTWSLIRFVRLGLGVLILIQGLIAREILSIVLGGIFAGMALTDIGCTGSCPVNSPKPKTGNEPPSEEAVVNRTLH